MVNKSDILFLIKAAREIIIMVLVLGFAVLDRDIRDWFEKKELNNI